MKLLPPAPALALRLQAAAPITVIHAAGGMGKTCSMLGEFERLRAAGIAASWIEGNVLADPIDADAASLRLPAHGGTVFVDDAHRLGRRGLDAIIATTTGHSLRRRLVIAVRRLDGLGLARLVAQGQVDLIDGSLLAWSRRQLATIWSSKLSATHIAAIVSLTEGWAAPSQLLAHAVANGAIIDRQRSYLAQSLISTYLHDEILGILPKWMLPPLLTAALPAVFDQTLLDRIGGPCSLQIGTLQDHLGVLLVQQDGSWRFNRLLREQLLQNFGQLPRRHQHKLTHTVADWASERGDVVGAARLVSRSGDGRRIVDFAISAGGLTLWLVKGYDYVRDLVEAAGEHLVATEPRLQLLRCVVLLKEGRIGEAERLYRNAVRHLPADPDARRDAALVQATLTVYGCRVASARDDSAFRLLDHLATDAGWKTMLPTIQAIRASQRGDFGAATAALAEATRHSVAAGITYNLLFLDFHKAGVSLAQGAFEETRKVLARARRRWRKAYREDRGAETVLNALLAQLDFESGRRRQAVGHLRKSAHRFPHSEAWLDIYVAAYEPMMRLLAEDSGIAAACGAIERASAGLQEQCLERIVDLLAALRTCLEGEAVLRGHGDAVQMRGGDPSPTGDDANQTWHETEFFALARAYRALATGDPARSRTELDHLLHFSRARGLRRTELRALLLRCATFDRLGCSDLADADFASALAIAAQTGMRRAFQEFGGASVQRRLDPSRARGSALPNRSIIDDINRIKSSPVLSDARPLSRRELEVIEELVAGGSDKAIGRRLSVTEHAVRFHLKNIYAKFGVHSREDAIKRHLTSI